MPPSQYTAKILNPSAWGGAIELGILASHFQTEIASIDVETGRVDHFSPPHDHDVGGMRCILIYSGIHYDAATLAPTSDAQSEWHQTLFPVVGF
jgi:ubiquitin thioesterase OTU1